MYRGGVGVREREEEHATEALAGAAGYENGYDIGTRVSHRV
jgi:hypothetical protein